MPALRFATQKGISVVAQAARRTDVEENPTLLEP